MAKYFTDYGRADPQVLVPATEDAQFAYLAGIIDGEGSFQVSAKSRSFGLAVSSIDECLPLWLHQTFAGSRTAAIAKTTAGNDVFRWFLTRQADLRYALERMRPYLVIKQKQADAMLVFLEHLRNPPRWEVPTSHSPRRVRPERKEAWRIWRAERERLRMAVRKARY